MTTQQFQDCKADFLNTYHDILCEESLDEINNANTPQEFIRLLHTFSTFLRYKVIPSADWARKWFADEKELTNSCGVYIDQILFIKDPEERSLVLIGNSHLKVMYTKAQINHIALQDESTVSLLMYNAAHCTVREKGIGKTDIIMCNKPAIVKIHKI